MLAAGMGKGTRVGLYFPYGQDWVVAWLAASRIGALVMPLATTYRPAEIRKVLRIGDIDTLLTARVGARSRHAGHARGERARPRRRHRSRGCSSPTRRSCARCGSPGTIDRRWATHRRLRRRRRCLTTSPTTSCVRSRPRWCRPTSRRSPTRRDRAPIRRASCTRTARSCAPRPGSPRCRPPTATPSAVRSARSPSSGSAARSSSAPRCSRARPCSCIERFEPGAALDLIEAGAGDPRARVADPPAVDARPPVVRGPRPARDRRAHRRPRRPRARRRSRSRASPRTAA